MATIPKIVAQFTTTLANKITSSATTMTLVSGVDAAGNTLSGVYGFVIDEGTASEEFVMGTVSGTSVTGLTRGLDPQNPSTEVSALKKEHRRGAAVKITDYPLSGAVYRVLNGTDGFPSKLKYDSDLSFTDAKEIVSKKYVDDTATVGAPDASTTTKGIAKLSTAPASASNPIAVGDNDPRLPTQAENDALAGTGTPSGANRYVVENDPNLTNNVKTSGDQTVAGVKTFSSIPVLPASDPTTDNQAVRKSYADTLATPAAQASVADSTITIYYRKVGKVYFGLHVHSGGSGYIMGGQSDAEARGGMDRLASLLGVTISSYYVGDMSNSTNRYMGRYSGGSWSIGGTTGQYYSLGFKIT